MRRKKCKYCDHVNIMQIKCYYDGTQILFQRQSFCKIARTKTNYNYDWPTENWCRLTWVFVI